MLSEACLADQLQHVHKVDLMAGLVENNGTQHLRPQELAVLRQVSFLGAEAFSGRELVLCTAQMVEHALRRCLKPSCTSPVKPLWVYRLLTHGHQQLHALCWLLLLLLPGPAYS